MANFSLASLGDAFLPGGGGNSGNAPKDSSKKMRKTIKSFFGTPSKFQKGMKRGVYFATLVYCEGKVLVTNDEVLPIIEIGKCSGIGAVD